MRFSGDGAVRVVGVALLLLALLVAGFAMTRGYHEKALVFTYERYEQILPYTMPEP